MTAVCSTCGRAIEWATFAKSGKPVPLDVGRFDNGNIEVVRIDDAHSRVLVRLVPLAERGERFLARTHFASCPHASQHRRTQNR